MNPRRQFLAAAIAASVYPGLATAVTPNEDGAAAIERLRRFYGSLKSYSAVTRTTATTLGMEVPGEVRTAFVRPGRLCMQLGVRGKMLNTFIVDGETFDSWNPDKGWRADGRFGMTVAGLHGASVMVSLFPYYLALLLFNDDDPAEGLQNLQKASCELEAGRCARLQGATIQDTRIEMELDAANGAIRAMHTEEVRRSISISIKAEVDARYEADLDMDGVIEALRRDPSKPIKV